MIYGAIFCRTELILRKGWNLKKSCLQLFFLAEQRVGCLASARIAEGFGSVQSDDL